MRVKRKIAYYCSTKILKLNTSYFSLSSTWYNKRYLLILSLMNAKIFKAYDIRGIYGTDFDEHDAYAIGRATVDFLGCQRLAVGRDARA